MNALSAFPRRVLIAVLVAGAGGMVATPGVAARAPLEVGDRRQVFIDGRFFAVSTGVQLQTHAAQKTGEPNLIPDRPWEDSMQAGTVIKIDGTYPVCSRRDGFVSARGAYTGGEFTTPPLRFDGDLVLNVDAAAGGEVPRARHAGGSFATPVITFAGRELRLNVNTSAGGELRVELQDELGVPLPGYSLAEADMIHSTNETGRLVTWQGKSDVSSLAGRPVRLHVTMQDVDLFAFQFGAPSTR